MLFWEDSILARAQQVLGLEKVSELKLKERFRSLITKVHPDTGDSRHEDHAKVLIEAYHVLLGEIQPSDCKLLEKDDLVASLLPEGAKPVELGIKYEDWMKERFYEFCKP